MYTYLQITKLMPLSLSLSLSLSPEITREFIYIYIYIYNLESPIKIIHKLVPPTSTNLTPPHFPSLRTLFSLLFSLLETRKEPGCSHNSDTAEIA
jgi:hypothetical protein